KTRVVIDQIISWVPSKGSVVSVINVEEILEQLVTLADIRYVSYDQFQSQYTLEKAIRQGINSEKHNVNDNDYILYRNMLHAGAVSYPNDLDLIGEMQKLVYDGKRVDHIYSSCFTGDTKIALADGRNVEIKDLVLEHSWGKKNFVYSISNIKKFVVPKPIKSAFCSGFSKII